MVLHTVDGGATWEQVLVQPVVGYEREPIYALQAVDGLRAWAIVADTGCRAPCLGELRATIDGGKTWRTLYRGLLSGARFASARRGWVVVSKDGIMSDVLATSDGGNTWKTSLRERPIVAIDAADERTAWVVALDGAFCTSSNCSTYELLQTTDGGGSWTSLGNPKDQATCEYATERPARERRGSRSRLGDQRGSADRGEPNLRERRRRRHVARTRCAVRGQALRHHGANLPDSRTVRKAAFIGFKTPRPREAPLFSAMQRLVGQPPGFCKRLIRLAAGPPSIAGLANPGLQSEQLIPSRLTERRPEQHGRRIG